jgi:hypothetical protein
MVNQWSLKHHIQLQIMVLLFLSLLMIMVLVIILLILLKQCLNHHIELQIMVLVLLILLMIMVVVITFFDYVLVVLNPNYIYKFFFGFVILDLILNGCFDHHPLDFSETIYKLNYSALDLGFDGFYSIYDHDHCPFDYGLIVLNPNYMWVW